MKKKILVAGDVNGNFDPLLKQLDKFDFCICVGSTCALTEQFCDILSGKIAFSRPVYFVDNGPLKDILSLRFSSQGGELAKNFVYLGNFGIKKIEGFKVCFLSGVENSRKLDQRSQEKNLLLDECNIYAEGDFAHIVTQEISSPDFNGVDFLVTCEWPSGIEIKEELSGLQPHRK